MNRILGILVGALLTLSHVPQAAATPPARVDSSAATVKTSGRSLAPADEGRPNIVVFYIDDVPPHDARLWSDPALTPALHANFIAQGLNFENAIGETSLCCPARASLLSGQHTHNHGVLVNDARLFDPREHLGQAMKDAGYASIWVGKYLNLNHLLTPSQWTAHGNGWSQLDAIVSRGSGFFNYDLHTKQGTLPFTSVHSTRMVAERTIAHLRATPSTTPVFAVLSVFNMHGPNAPMPEFKNDARCSGMPPWNPPNYNEADVSDKPAAIRALPLQPHTGGWPMVGYCREALGVDWVIKQVTQELDRQGRLDNTLLVFTSDNGVGWGAHRIGQHKSFPYTTPVPLYVSWADRWGAEAREIPDLVSNIDLAPTFCALAGCDLDNYPGGQGAPDGIDLMPLMDGEVATLERDAVLESNWEAGRRWTAVRTGPNHALGQWHYVEYSTGELELYDLAADEWELVNRAGRGAYAATQSALADILDELRGRNAKPRVDATVAILGGTVKGMHLYRSEPVLQQTIKQKGLQRNTVRNFLVRIWNRGGTNDSVSVAAETSDTSAIAVTYHVAGVDVTASVESGTYVSPPLAIQGSITLTVRMTVSATAPAGIRSSAVVRVSSVADPTRLDVVKAVGIR